MFGFLFYTKIFSKIKKKTKSCPQKNIPKKIKTIYN